MAIQWNWSWPGWFLAFLFGDESISIANMADGLPWEAVVYGQATKGGRSLREGTPITSSVTQRA